MCDPLETHRNGGRSILTTITTSEAAARGYARLGFAHRKPPPVVFVVVESLDRSVSLGVGVHLDKTEPLAASHVTVLDDLGALHCPVLCEPLLQISMAHRIGQVTNIQFLSHDMLLVARLFDPLNGFVFDEKEARNGAHEVGETRGGCRKRFYENPRCSLSRHTNPLKYN